MKQTAYESLLEVKHKFPNLSKALKDLEQIKKKKEKKGYPPQEQLIVDAANLILSLWKSNPDLKVSKDVAYEMFAGDDAPYYPENYYPDLSIVHDKDTRHYIVDARLGTWKTYGGNWIIRDGYEREEVVFLYLQNFTKSELVSLDNDTVAFICHHLLSVNEVILSIGEVIPFLEWLFDGDVDRIRAIVPEMILGVKVSAGINDLVQIKNFIDTIFNEKYYNKSYIMNHYSVIVGMLKKFWRLHIKDAFQVHNPYLIHALFNADMYSDIFNSKSHNGYTENQIKFFSVLYACNVYNGGGRVSTHGSIPKYMRHKNHLGDLYQPLKSMLDGGYNFAQIYDRIKHRFADIF